MTTMTTTQQQEKAIYDGIVALEDERRSYIDENGKKWRRLGQFLTDTERATMYMNKPHCTTKETDDYVLKNGRISKHCDKELRSGARSWYKKLGYGDPCRCAVEAMRVECGKQDLVGIL